MTVTTKCPKCGHIIEITDQIHSDVQLICDSLAAEADQLKSEMAPLKTIKDAMPAQEDVRLALLALNDGGECNFREDLCGCDHDTGPVPCAYCAIYTVLQRVLRVVRFRDADEQSIDDGLATEVKQLKQSLVELHKLLTDAAVAFGNGTSADHDPPTPNPDGDYLIGCIRKSWLGDTLIAIHKEHVIGVTYTKSMSLL